MSPHSSENKHESNSAGHSAEDSISSADQTALVQGMIEQVAKRMLIGFPTVRRWYDTSDISQQAIMKLLGTLNTIPTSNREQLENLIVVHTRRTLLELLRNYSPVADPENNRWTPYSADCNVNKILEEVEDPNSFTGHISKWVELHEAVEEMPEKVSQVFHLIWYREYSKQKVSQSLGLSLRQVQRYWREARIIVAKRVDSSILDSI